MDPGRIIVITIIVITLTFLVVILVQQYKKVVEKKEEKKAAENTKIRQLESKLKVLSDKIMAVEKIKSKTVITTSASQGYKKLLREFDAVKVEIKKEIRKETESDFATLANRINDLVERLTNVEIALGVKNEILEEITIPELQKVIIESIDDSPLLTTITKEARIILAMKIFKSIKRDLGSNYKAGEPFKYDPERLRYWTDVIVGEYLQSLTFLKEQKIKEDQQKEIIWRLEKAYADADAKYAKNKYLSEINICRFNLEKISSGQGVQVYEPDSYQSLKELDEAEEFEASKTWLQRNMPTLFSKKK